MRDGQEKNAKDLLKEVSGSLRGRGGEKESLLSSILGDQRVMEEYRRLGFKEEEAGDWLVALSSYQESLDICAKCPGLRECPAPVRHCRYTLRVDDDGALGVALGLCDLRRSREIMQNAFLFRDFPQEWLEIPPQRRLPRAGNLGAIYVQEILKGKGARPTFYLEGPQGVGKSFLAASLAMSQAEAGRSVAFLDCGRRLEELAKLSSDYRNPGAFQERMGELLGADLLVLDDFGSGYMTARIRDQVLLPLLEGRLRAHKATLLTSRDDYRQIAQEYGRIQYGARQGERLAECLREGIGDRSHVHLKARPVAALLD